jgi:hypothetical protein
VNHEQLKAIALNRGDVKTEYDALEAEFSLLRQMLAARQRAGLTQAEIASLASLRKYAEAVGCHIEIKLVPN